MWYCTTWSLLTNTLMHHCAFHTCTPTLPTAHTQKHKHICPLTLTQLHSAMHPDVCTHTHADTHTATQGPWNPRQISCCSYVKWIKPVGSTSSKLTRTDNSQTATCSPISCVCVCVLLCVSSWVCVDVTFEQQMMKALRSDLMCECFCVCVSDSRSV